MNELIPVLGIGYFWRRSYSKNRNGTSCYFSSEWYQTNELVIFDANNYGVASILDDISNWIFATLLITNWKKKIKFDDAFTILINY